MDLKRAASWMPGGAKTENVPTRFHKELSCIDKRSELKLHDFFISTNSN